MRKERNRNEQVNLEKGKDMHVFSNNGLNIMHDRIK